MIDLNMTFFAQILNFLILVAILRALCYKPVVRMIQAREDKIAESLEKADADVAAAEELKAKYQAQLAEARERAAELQRLAVVRIELRRRGSVGRALPAERLGGVRFRARER